MGRTSSSEIGSENPWPWIIGIVGLGGFVAWKARGEGLYVALAPYGLTTEDTRSVPSVYGGTETSYGTGHFQINPAGWLTLGIAVVGLVALLWCVVAAVNVTRWRSDHGIGAVPKLPVPALAAFIAASVFLVVLFWLGRSESTTVHMMVFMLGMFVGVCAGLAVMTFASMRADYWRKVQAFAGRADQVLGHGHPDAGRVKAPFKVWQVRISEDGRDRRWPGKLVAVTGPGWKHRPSELDELNRYARSFGWPPYEWTGDAMSKRITGTARPDVESLGG